MSIAGSTDRLLQLPPLALYVHIPWCVRKCPYCDFNSHRATEIPEDAYVACLLDDLTRDASWAQGRELQSIFFGGGTPSLFSADSIARLLEGIDGRVPIARNAEITLEANPGTAEQEKFSGFRNAGVNRLSMGIQSFNPEHLQKLGRIHNGEDAVNAIAMARRAGFENFNLDLMHGLPDQTLEQALHDLDTALSFEPPHLSWYQLTIETNTAFHNAPPVLPEDDTLWAIQQAGEEKLIAHGFDHYEVSAYAQAGRHSRHNLNYWQFGDYLAIGAGAHGKITFPAQGRVQRYRKTRLPQDYLNLAKSFTAACDTLAQDDLPFEFFMNALRLREGVPAALFEQRTGLSLASIDRVLQRAVQDGLLLHTPSQLAPTAQGWLFLNDLVEHFLSSPEASQASDQ